MHSILKMSAVVAVATAAMFAVPVMAAGTMAPATHKTAPMTHKAPVKKIVLTFAKIDANHDGKIEYVELKKYFPHLTHKEFARFDHHKGYLDHAGLAAFFKAQHAKPTVSKMAPHKTVTKKK